MGLRDRLRRLERKAEKGMFEVLQPDGTIKRFPASDGLDALLALVDGRDHPLAEAVRNSPDPKWQTSFYNMFPADPAKVPDLSE